MMDSIEALCLKLERLAQQVVRSQSGQPVDPSTPVFEELQATHKELNGVLDHALIEQERKHQQEMEQLQKAVAAQALPPAAPAPAGRPADALAFEKVFDAGPDFVPKLLTDLVDALPGHR